MLLMYFLLTPSISSFLFFFFNDTATTEIYTLSLHDALPIFPIVGPVQAVLFFDGGTTGIIRKNALRLDPTGFSNLTTQFPDAAQDAGLTQQLSISHGTNFRPRGSTGLEFVDKLPIIQAPFLIDY